MMQKLGAKIDSDEPDTQVLKDSSDGPPIQVIHDMAHSVKCVRNSWAKIKILKNSKGQEIDWNYIVKLYDLQCKEELVAANKLTSKHIHFENHKMKVVLATQIFSRSVAKSLKFCREVLKLPAFLNSKPTEEFLIIMNDTFDLLNSRSSKGIKFKGPLRLSNQEDWLPFFNEAREYLAGLTNGVTGAIMVKTDPKKTGFLGIICNIIAVIEIYKANVLHGPLDYLLTYKLSQDHLEHYFGIVRSRLGANNNPTPLHFRYIYRRLLLGVTNSIVSHSNVLLQDNSEIIGIIPSTCDKIDYVIDNYNMSDIDFDFINNSTISNFKKNVLEYIGGFVVKKICLKMYCENCCDAITGTPPETLVNLIKLKDYGNLMTYPSQLVCKVIEFSEQIIVKEIRTTNWLSKPFFFDFLCVKIVKSYMESNKIVLLDCNHNYELYKKIVACYTSIKLKHHIKLENEKMKKKRLRNKLCRAVINYHE